MIKMTDIMDFITNAIEKDSNINGILNAYKNHAAIFQGFMPVEFSEVNDNTVYIFVIPTGADEFGYTGETRDLNFQIKVHLYNNNIVDDGVLRKHVATEDLIDLLYYIAVAIKSVETIGDHVVGAKASYDLEAWPVVKGTLEIRVELPVGLNAEAEL